MPIKPVKLETEKAAPKADGGGEDISTEQARESPMERNEAMAAEVDVIAENAAESEIDFGGLKKDLKIIFSQLNIQKVLYIDDEFNDVYDWERVTEELLGLERKIVNDLFADVGAITEAPGEFLKSELGSHIDNIKADDEAITAFVKMVKGIGIEAKSQVKSPVMETLLLLFDKQQLQALSPKQWKTKVGSLGRMVKPGPVLMLCDQDLQQQETGGDIIKFLKTSEFADCFYCALISDLIHSTQRELTWMKEKKAAGELPDVNFFALSKKRTDDPVLICDGIKKTLLNDYLEKIKTTANDVLHDAFEKTLEEVKAIDTYDFDHSILRASVSEGVWEIDTLLRIVKSIFNKQVKLAMIDKQFLKQTNPNIKKAVDVSQVRFKVNRNKTYEPPYDKRYHLRQEELYEDGKLINELYSPITNGDIFRVSMKGSLPGEEREERLFILVDQECDIVIRAKGRRNRKTDFSTLLPISIKTIDEIEADRYAFNQEHGLTNYYFHNRFKLDYLEHVEHQEYKHGIVEFTNPYFVCFDVLDLVSFNHQGKTLYTVRNESDSLCDPDLLSIAVENRMKKVDVTFKQKLRTFNALYQELGDMHGKETLFERIKGVVTITPCVNFPLQMGIPITFKTDMQSLEFGITRIKRLSVTKSKNLLSRYNDYLSRFADDHDFARDLKK